MIHLRFERNADMNRTLIELPSLPPDGRLYHTELDTIEALIPNTPYASCHAPDLLEVPGGDLLCVWFAGSSEGNADISIVGSRLKAGESQWSEPVRLSDDPTRSEQNPSLFLHPNGDIWLMYTAQEARTPLTPPSKSLQYTAEIRRKVSHDNGFTWGPAETMFSHPGSFCRQKIQILSSRRWIFGNWLCFDDATLNGSDKTVFQLSDDQGASWRTVELPGSEGRVHANVVETEPGKLTAFLRSRFADRIWMATSKDYGDHWTLPVRTDLRNNNSSLSAVLLPSGAIGIIYNDVAFSEEPSAPQAYWPAQRCPVTLAISEDGGHTWPYRRHIEFGEGFCGPWNDINNRRYEYPVMMVGSDAALHTAWAWGGRRQIKYTAITEDWIRGSQIQKGLHGDGTNCCIR